MSNQVQHTILDAARTKVDAEPEVLQWEAEYDVFYAKLLAVAPELAKEFFQVCIGGMVVRGEAMFLEGCRLRGNPSELFELPDDE